MDAEISLFTAILSVVDRCVVVLCLLLSLSLLIVFPVCVMSMRYDPLNGVERVVTV